MSRVTSFKIEDDVLNSQGFISRTKKRGELSKTINELLRREFVYGETPEINENT